MRWLIGVGLFLIVLLGGPAYLYVTDAAGVNTGWHEANRESAGMAPEPDAHPGAVVQVYAARAFSWRGVFAVHSWVAAKEAGAERYRVYEVTSWRGGRVASGFGIPDRNWFGSAPKLLLDLRGDEASALIPRIADAVERYPHNGDYAVWPGPNSNTFVAWLIREVSGLDAALPPTAVGKDYLSGALLAPMPSGTGYQVSVNGVASVGIARVEGLEVNILGMVIGVDPFGLAVKLPGVGHVGLRESPLARQQ